MAEKRYLTYKENFALALADIRSDMSTAEIKTDLIHPLAYHKWYVEALEQVLAERTGKL